VSDGLPLQRNPGPRARARSPALPGRPAVTTGKTWRAGPPDCDGARSSRTVRLRLPTAAATSY